MCVFVCVCVLCVCVCALSLTGIGSDRSRLIQRADDTAEKAQVRLDTYHNNIAAIKECYEDIIRSLDGSVGKAEVKTKPKPFRKTKYWLCTVLGWVRLDWQGAQQQHWQLEPFSPRVSGKQDVGMPNDEAICSPVGA